MDYLALLRISARLLDLHDSERTAGNPSAFSQEERRGAKNGHYLDIASAVLDLLRSHGQTSGNEFVGFDALLVGVRAVREEIDEEDLRYVLNVLSRPTELWAIDRQEGLPRQISDKASALVERTFFADDYRLAPAGRAALAVAAGIQAFAYAEGDVLKLLRAIEAGDFTLVPMLCSTLLDTIRNEGSGMRRAIERGFVDRESPLFTEQLPRYREVIKHSAELLRQADLKLRTWRAVDDDDLDEEIDVDLQVHEQQILKVYQALESFGRELSELTALASQRRVSVVAPPDYLASALALVRKPPKAAQLNYLFKHFGPVLFNGVYPSPMDVVGRVRIATQRLESSSSFDTSGASVSTVDLQLQFIERYGDEIRKRLAVGPLPILEAIGNGWCVLESTAVVADLIKVYVSPWALGLDGQIRLAIPESRVERPDSLAGDLVLNDLSLVMDERV